ncbi:TIGR04347 family pseudo-SAM/SPASM protein [Haloarchaeobius baliensis]|uniref:TIGR04347 family pseudo-SAM/SPASM protein n=1 Tax=Haloarchaeobius baliensis TaxID=1670458 RepID=UPI003F882EF7
MISVSKLLCGLDAEGDGLRYDAADESDKEQISDEKQRRPVVVWNTTRGCNLYCEHCYASACDSGADGEFSTREGKRLLDDLAEYGVPVVLFSGGEPLVRPDLVELVDYAAHVGLRPVLSTNGTLITDERAEELADAGLAYAGISVDGMAETNDHFRGKDGAFDAAVRGIEHCLDAGLKTGLRYTITQHNRDDLRDIVDLLADTGLDRFCFYHLAYGGRGADISDTDLSTAARREAVREVCDLTRAYHDDGHEIETLLVGNYADAGYITEYARREMGEDHARTVRRYLETNGGDPAGERVADIDYQGNVHLNQFWQSYSLGNVRDRAFGDIWEDDSNPLVNALRSRENRLQGRCTDCQYADICKGGSPLRSLAVHDDPFAPDPQCYLSPEERAPDTGGLRPTNAD